MQIMDAVALVTGASSGLGAVTAERLSAAGAHVLVHGRDNARLAEVAHRVKATPLAADLTDTEGVQRLAKAAIEVAGRVDILVNNAGLGWAGRLAAMPDLAAADLIAVNLAAPIALTKALLPGMLAADRGRIIFVTSIAGRTAVAGEAVYAATKAGLDLFAESLSLELHGTGVGVGVFVPGVVDTPFFQRRGLPYQRSRPRPRPVAQIADALVQMIATDRSERYAPRWLRFPVVVRAAVPGSYRRLAARFGETPKLAAGGSAPDRSSGAEG